MVTRSSDTCVDNVEESLIFYHRVKSRLKSSKFRNSEKI